MKALAGLGAFVEFSFFFVNHALQAGLTHVDAETHTVPPMPPPVLVELIRAATSARTIVNSDAGVFCCRRRSKHCANSCCSSKAPACRMTICAPCRASVPAGSFDWPNLASLLDKSGDYAFAKRSRLLEGLVIAVGVADLGVGLPEIAVGIGEVAGA